MNEKISALCRQLGYRFHNEGLVEQALSHRSVGKQNNERLEFLGDSILGFIISTRLYEQFPQAPEGELSQMRARLVKGKTLATIARGLSLGDYVILGPGELKSGGHRRESILADTLEALIGAICLDGGLDAARSMVLGWFDERLNSLEVGEGAHKDAKTRLQEYLQARKQPLPRYRLVDTLGSDHQQSFLVECEISLSPTPFAGKGGSRRNAEQVAAEAALTFLNNRDSQ